MRETEILRGLGKAKAQCFADGTAQVVSPRLAAFRAAHPVQHVNSFEQHAKDMAELAAQRARASATPQSAVPAAAAVSSGVLGSGLAAGAAETLQRHNATTQKAIHDATGFERGTAKIEGPGTTTSDSVPAWLSKGEAVLPAKTVKAVGAKNIANLIEVTNGKPPKGPVQSTSQGRIGALGELGVPDPTTEGHFADGFVPDNVVGGLRKAYDSLKSAGADAYNKAKTALTASAPAAEATAESAKWYEPAGAGMQRISSGLRSAGNVGMAAVKKGIVPAATIGSAMSSYNTPTEEYQKRTGIQSPLGARALGVMGDLGNTLTLGLAGKLGEALAGHGTTTTPTTPTSEASTTPHVGTVTQGAISAEGAPMPTADSAASTFTDTSELGSVADMMRDNMIQSTDDLETRARKKNNLASLQAMSGLGQARLSADVSKYGADLGLLGNRMANNVAYAKLNNELRDKAGERHATMLQAAFPDYDDKGKLIKGGQNYNDAMGKFAGTLGKYGLELRDMHPEDINKFIDMAQTAKSADEFNQSLTGKLWQGILQERAAQSRDLNQYGATSEQPGVFFNDTTRGIAGRIPNVTTMQSGAMFGLPNQDLIDLTREQLTKAHK